MQKVSLFFAIILFTVSCGSSSSCNPDASIQLSLAERNEIAALQAECDADASTCPEAVIAIGSIYNDAQHSSCHDLNNLIYHPAKD